MPSPNTDKTALPRGASSPGRPCTYRHVLAALQSDEARSAALGRFRAAGFVADDFAHRPAARAAMVEALVSTEDALESAARGRLTAERMAVRAVRRRLEAECCP